MESQFGPIFIVTTIEVIVVQLFVGPTVVLVKGSESFGRGSCDGRMTLVRFRCSEEQALFHLLFGVG